MYFLSPRTIIYQTFSSLLTLHNLLVFYSVKKFTTPLTTTRVSASSNIVPGHTLCFGLLSCTRSLEILIQVTLYAFVICVLYSIRRCTEVFGPTSSNMSGSGRSMPVPQQPAVQMPMDNTEFLMTQSSHRSNTYIHPQHTAVSMPQHHSSTQATICCSVSQGMAEVKAMLHNFQQDLNRVMAINFHEPLPSRSSRPSSPAHVGPTSAPPPFLCSSCTQHRQGTWYSCNDCHVVVVRSYDS